MKTTRLLLLASTLIVVIGTIGGCGSTGTTSYLHDEYNFEFVERIAIIPFENLSNDRGAGARATHVFLAEILAAKAFDVVEPGEVSHVLGKYSTVRASELTMDQIIGIGKELKVQGLFFGAVTESASQRTGGTTVTKVTIASRLVETESGSTVWSASTTASSKGFWASLFGTGGKSTSEVTRDCVRKALDTLFN